MKRKTLFNIGYYLMLAGLLFGFLETWYFGWNETPINDTEAICDIIARYMIVIGIGIYMAPVLGWLKSMAIESEEDKDKWISGKLTGEQTDFLETIIHEDGGKNQIEAIQWCIDSCKKIEEEHGVDACHVGFHGLPRSDDMIMKKIHELLGQDYRVEFANAIHGCITVYLLKYKNEQLIKSDHTITIDDINYIYPFTKRLCLILDELKCQIDELIAKPKP